MSVGTAVYRPATPRMTRPVAITRVSVVPMDRERVLPDHTVVIEDGRIAAVTAGSVNVSGMDVVDGAGRWLMPGLADMHVHLWDAGEDILYLANGITTIRNMAGVPRHLVLRARVRDGTSAGPQVITTTPLVDGAWPNGNTIWPGSYLVERPEEAERLVRAFAQRGYDQLKVYSLLAREPHAALCRAAADVGLLVTGHCPNAMSFEEAIAAGQRCFEHLTGIATGHLRDGARLPDPRDAAKRLERMRLMVEGLDLDAIRRLADEMARRDVWNCPTLVVQQQRDQRPEDALADPDLRYVSSTTIATWDPAKDFRRRDQPGSAEELRLALRALGEINIRIVGILHEAGAPLLLGTDTPNPFVIPGFSIHHELGNLVRAGLSPYDALRCGTAAAARFVGQDREWGTIAEGKRADLLLLSADPLADVGAARRIEAVFVNGYHCTRADLDRGLEHRVTALAAARVVALDGATGEGGDTIAEGELIELVAGIEAGRCAYRHRRLPSGDIRIDERHAFSEGLEFDGTRTTTFRLRGDLSIDEGRCVVDTALGATRLAVTRDGDHYDVEHTDVDGRITRARLDGPLVPSERLSATALALVAAGVRDGDRRLRALSFDLGAPAIVEARIERAAEPVDEGEAGWEVTLERRGETTKQTYLLGPNDELRAIRELTWRGLRELRRP